MKTALGRDFINRLSDQLMLSDRVCKVRIEADVKGAVWLITEQQVEENQARHIVKTIEALKDRSPSA